MEDKTFYFVGIAGGSASGKTTFLEKLRERFSEKDLCIISQDDYYLPFSQQVMDDHGVVNYDLPSSIDLEKFIQDITLLQHGKSVQIKEYIFNNPNAVPKIKTLNPAHIVVVEGLFIFHYPEISNFLDLKLFIDAPHEVRFKRRVERDLNVREIPEDIIKHQWENHVTPSYNSYLLPYRDDCDIIVTNNISFDKGYEVVIHHLELILKGKKS